MLVRGKREEAVDCALREGQYGLALLIAGMCGRDTYQKAAEHFCAHALAQGSPLHTVSVMFSSPSQVAVSSNSLFGDSSTLKTSWRNHLAAIINNRIPGWESAVSALGDRLRFAGLNEAAHFCFMVCGTPLSSPILKDSRWTLVGCDITPSDVMLRTDTALESFLRTEAYEWAKRRGNMNATVRTLQAFKAMYAMRLAEYGFDEDAYLYVSSALECLGESSYDDFASTDMKKPLGLAVLSTEKKSLVAALIDLRDRLEKFRYPGSGGVCVEQDGLKTNADGRPLQVDVAVVDSQPLTKSASDCLGASLNNAHKRQVSPPVPPFPQPEPSEEIDSHAKTVATTVKHTNKSSAAQVVRRSNIQTEGSSFAPTHDLQYAPAESMATSSKSSMGQIPPRLVDGSYAAAPWGEQDAPSMTVPARTTSSADQITQRSAPVPVQPVPPKGPGISPTPSSADQITERSASVPAQPAPPKGPGISPTPLFVKPHSPSESSSASLVPPAVNVSKSSASNDSAAPQIPKAPHSTPVNPETIGTKKQNENNADKSLPPRTPRRKEAAVSLSNKDSKNKGDLGEAPVREPKATPKPTRANELVPKAPASAPANLNKTNSGTPNSENKRGWFDFGIRNYFLAKLHPDAHVATVGGEMEAYYDEKERRWIFPGDDPNEAPPSAGPPPTTPVAAKPESSEESKPVAPADPLSMMMAPPPGRRPGGARSRSAPVSSAKSPPSAMTMSGAAPGTGTNQTPQFSVFKPPC